MKLRIKGYLRKSAWKKSKSQSQRAFNENKKKKVICIREKYKK